MGIELHIYQRFQVWQAYLRSPFEKFSKMVGRTSRVRKTCQAYWEDSQIKGWFPAIILAFGGKYRLKLPKVKKLEMDFS